MNNILPSDILYSKEKIDLLSLLHDGPKEKENILEKLGISSQKLSPQLVELTDTKIITFQDNKYTLSTMGDLLLTEITLALDALRFLDNEYWWNHNFNFIPSPLLRKLCKIKDWIVVEPKTSEMYDYNRNLYDRSISSDSLSTVTTSTHPNFFKLASDGLDHKTSTSVVFDYMTFDKLRKDHNEELQKLIINKHFKMYVYPRSISLLSFVVADSYLLLRPLTNDGAYDHTQLISNSQEAVELGRVLFDYYVKESKQITEL